MVGTFLNTVSVVCAGFHLCLCVLTLYRRLGCRCFGKSADAAAAAPAAFFFCCSMIGTFSLTLAWLPRRVLTGESDAPRVIVPLYPLELSAFCMNSVVFYGQVLL